MKKIACGEFCRRWLCHFPVLVLVFVFVAPASAQQPGVFTDVPDIDVIRVGNDYYMTSTTMHLCPGVPVMHSKDLKNWEIINYVYDILEDNDRTTLSGGHGYGSGSWASSIRYVNGVFHICFIANEQKKTYIYHTTDLRKPRSEWTRTEFNVMFHDPALIYDNGRAFVAFGNGKIHITELTPDFSGIKEGGVNQLLVDATDKKCMLNAEGSHLYKVGNYYYLFVIDWPAGGIRREVCFRTKNLLGDWEKKIIYYETLNEGLGGFTANGCAQGGIVDRADGTWQAFLFQDQGPLGRAPVFMDMTWEDGWPVFASVKDNKGLGTLQPSICHSDEFSNQQLSMAWQWNHNPVNDSWSLTERPGWMRLHTACVAPHIFRARNSLSQRLPGGCPVTEVCMDAKGMTKGDRAGICAFQSNYASIGVEVNADGKKELIVRQRNSKGQPRTSFVLDDDGNKVVYKQALGKNKIYLRISYKFYDATTTSETMNTATLAYSYDGRQWTDVGVELKMQYTLDVFMGYRTFLYCYATEKLGGYVDFDYYRVNN